MARNPLTVPVPLGNWTVSVLGASARTVTMAASKPSPAIATAALKVCFIGRLLLFSTACILTLARRLRHHLRHTFHLDRRPVSNHLGDALHHFVRVVSHSHHSVRAVLRRMFHHQIERLFARLLAHIFKEGDVPAYDRLQGSPQSSKDAA